MKEKVEKALDSIRPSLQADGGDIELVTIEKDGTVKVKLTGHCAGCPMSQMTILFGVQEALKEAVPEVKEVIAV